jgi:transcriptional regulator with XRE-family HTH domain
MEKTIHHGRNVKRFREMLGIKQEALAIELGDEWNQRKVSILESKEEIDEELMSKVATALKVPVEAIKKFDEEKAIYAIQSFHDTEITHSTFQIHPTFNPLDKYAEAVEDIKKVNSENVPRFALSYFR